MGSKSIKYFTYLSITLCFVFGVYWIQNTQPQIQNTQTNRFVTIQFSSPQNPSPSTGSAVIYQSKMVVTAAHILLNDDVNSTITVFQDGLMKGFCTRVAVDRIKDLALLDCPLDGNYDLLPIKKAQLNEEVYSLGSPYGLGFVSLKGTVSNPKMLFHGQEKTFLNVMIHQGMSGGPVFDFSGNLIGINQMYYSRSQQIPTNLAAISTADHLVHFLNSVNLGLVMEPKLLPKIKLVLMEIGKTHLTVNESQEDAFKPQDKIVSMNGYAIRDIMDFTNVVLHMYRDEKVKYIIERNGEKIEVIL